MDGQMDRQTCRQADRPTITKLIHRTTSYNIEGGSIGGTRGATINLSVVL